MKTGLYKTKNRVNDNLVYIKEIQRSLNNKAVKFEVTYFDCFRQDTVVMWLPLELFDRQFEFFDG